MCATQYGKLQALELRDPPVRPASLEIARDEQEVGFLRGKEQEGGFAKKTEQEGGITKKGEKLGNRITVEVF